MNARSTTTLKVVVLLIGLMTYCVAHAQEIYVYKHLRYEYKKTDGAQRPLIIIVPGFTQHNRSAEFLILKSFVLSRGYDYLIMNPAQHGEVIQWSEVFNWGKSEDEDLLALIDTLEIPTNHGFIHVLGFSLGARAALGFAAKEQTKTYLSSVIAVAAPYRVGDINFRLSGDFKRPMEGIISSMYAYDRSSLSRITYMTFVGLHRSMFIPCGESSASIRKISCPTLLVHSNDDWLTKSYHSRLLWDAAPDSSKTALVLIDTRAHAEDMLSRDGSKTRETLIAVIGNWLQMIDSGKLPGKSKKEWEEKTSAEMRSDPKVKKMLLPQRTITMMTTAPLYVRSAGLWSKSSDHSYALLTMDYNRHWTNPRESSYSFAMSPVNNRSPLLSNIRMGANISPELPGNVAATEATASVYYPIGSWLWIKRIGASTGIGNGFRRQIVSGDLSYLLLDFQVNYGRFEKGGNDFNFIMNFPLISNASGAYFAGVAYSQFFTSTNLYSDRPTLISYLWVGLPKAWMNSSLRVNIQWERTGLLSRNCSNTWSGGLSVNINEQ